MMQMPLHWHKHWWFMCSLSLVLICCQCTGLIGRQYCLGYCSDMITEVASNIGHPGLYCRRTVIKSWGPVVSPACYEHSPQILSLENRTKKIPSCLILHLHLYLIYIYLAAKNVSDNPAAGTPAKLTRVQHQPHMRTRLY